MTALFVLHRQKSGGLSLGCGQAAQWNRLPNGLAASRTHSAAGPLKTFAVCADDRDDLNGGVHVGTFKSCEAITVHPGKGLTNTGLRHQIPFFLDRHYGAGNCRFVPLGANQPRHVPVRGAFHRIAIQRQRGQRYGQRHFAVGVQKPVNFSSDFFGGVKFAGQASGYSNTNSQRKHLPRLMWFVRLPICLITESSFPEAKHLGQKKGSPAEATAAYHFDSQDLIWSVVASHSRRCSSSTWCIGSSGITSP